MCNDSRCFDASMSVGTKLHFIDQAFLVSIGMRQPYGIQCAAICGVSPHNVDAKLWNCAEWFEHGSG